MITRYAAKMNGIWFTSISRKAENVFGYTFLISFFRLVNTLVWVEKKSFPNWVGTLNLLQKDNYYKSMRTWVQTFCERNPDFYELLKMKLGEMK